LTSRFHRLWLDLREFDAQTVIGLGWAGLKNGALRRLTSIRPRKPIAAGGRYIAGRGNIDAL
jgi:hypothetical protein